MEKVINIDRKAELKNIYSGIDKVKEKTKDFFIKGFQLNVCYQQHWEEITDIFKKYLDVDLYMHGPIMTINELKNVRYAKHLSEILKNDSELREFLTVGFSFDNDDFEKKIEGRIFIGLLRMYPEYCRQKCEREFLDTIRTEKGKEALKKIMKLSGTILDTDKDIEDIVSDLTK